MLVAMATAGVSTGCTKWGTHNVYGKTSEVSRTLLGSPQIAETKSSSASAGFAVGTAPGVAAGGFAGESGSMVRKHCIQEARIEYVQPYEIHPVPVRRKLDVAGGVAAAFVGLGVIVGAKIASTTIFEPDDPLYEPPPDPTAGYVLGGLGMVGGIGLIAYSYTRLPAGPAPAIVPSERRWEETRFVEATGCGLVPGDRAGTDRGKASEGDVETRLRKLERLRKDGIISEKEYRKKKQELLDQL